MFILHMSRPLRKDIAKFGKMAAKRIDRLRAPTDETLMRPVRDRSGLMLGAFYRHAMHVRSNSRLGNRRSICGVIIILPIDKSALRGSAEATELRGR
jgi:hypothetical protein